MLSRALALKSPSIVADNVREALKYIYLDYQTLNVLLQSKGLLKECISEKWYNNIPVTDSAVAGVISELQCLHSPVTG